MEVLRVAAVDGRLTPDELDERLEAALSSRTLGELAALTADLVPGPSMPGAAMAQAEDVIRIDQRGGSVRRTGRWVVPQRLELRSSWCDVWLDFTDALITHNTLRIDLNMRGGSLILWPGLALSWMLILAEGALRRRQDPPGRGAWRAGRSSRAAGRPHALRLD